MEFDRKIYLYEEDLVEYFGECKRPLIAGKEILYAGWIHSIGIDPSEKNNKATVIGLVVQTSAISDKPHEVKLSNLENKPPLWKCVCSCKAGLGTKCKHIAACLLHILSNPILEFVSCTQTKQKWGQIGKKFASQFNGKCVKDLCHIPKKIAIKQKTMPLTTKREIFSVFVEANPNSELSKIIGSSRSDNLVICDEVPKDEHDFLKFLLSHNSLKEYGTDLNNYLCDKNFKNFFEKKVFVKLDEAIKISYLTRKQTSSQWMLERKVRITGSNCYNIYTYSYNKNQNWEKKLSAIYMNSFKGNNATRYGLKAEKIAKNVYGKHCLLFETGLLISVSLPFVAVSPDGIAYNGVESKLLEIKCPIKGKELTAKSLLPKLKFLKCDENNNYALSVNHQYYGQIQLGLAVTNLNFCDLVIFCTFDNSYETIIVQKDAIFLNKLVLRLKNIYFKNVMPFYLNSENSL